MAHLAMTARGAKRNDSVRSLDFRRGCAANSPGYLHHASANGYAAIEHTMLCTYYCTAYKVHCCSPVLDLPLPRDVDPEAGYCTQFRAVEVSQLLSCTICYSRGGVVHCTVPVLYPRSCTIEIKPLGSCITVHVRSQCQASKRALGKSHSPNSTVDPTTANLPASQATMSTTVASQHTQHSALLAHMLCGYRSKVCTEPRATKLDGSLHKLCEFHRRKANLNQQKLHRRHRLERELLSELSGAATGKSKRRRRRPDAAVLPVIEPLSAEDARAPDLHKEDLAMLELLLLDMQALPSFSAASPPLFDVDVSAINPTIESGLFAGSQTVIV